MKQSVKHILALSLGALLLASCGSQRAAVATTPQVEQQTPTPGTKPATTAPATSNHVSSIAATFGSWTTLQSGGSISLSGAQKLSASVNVRMERGKSIYISVRPLGLVEAARLVVKGDSVIVLDRLHKRYVCESIKSLIGGLPADVSTLQDILLGRAFILGKGTINPGNVAGLSLRNINGSYLLQPAGTYHGYAYGFKFNAKYCITSLEVTKAQSDVPVCAVTYADVVRTVAGNIAGSAAVKASTRSGDMNFKLTYSGQSWNVPVKIDDKIPSSYKRVSAKSVMSILQQ